jgi:hypothetical protein
MSRGLVSDSVRMASIRAAKSRVRLIAPAIGAGLFAACLILVARSRSQVVSETDVERTIQELAIRRSDRPNVDDGGIIGPWWVAASRVEPATGRLEHFRITSGPLRIAARWARVVVDPVDNAFSFELSDVVITRVPERDDDEDGHQLMTLEQYTLGPVPFDADIKPDPSPVLQQTVTAK